MMFTASNGYWPAAVSADSITASAPSNTAVATSDASARVGDGAEIMLSSICVATTTGRPSWRAARTMRFCASGTSSGGSSTPRSPRATITASESAHDLVQILDRLRLFHLGHDPGAAGGQRARLGHVLRPLHEGQADVVDALLEREGEVGPVLLGQRRDRQHDVRHVDALAIRQRAADHHLRLQRVAALVLHAQPSLPSSSSSVAADRGGGDDLRMRQIDALRVSGRRVEVEPERLPRLQMHPPAAEAADPQLRSLHVGQDADRPAGLLLESRIIAMRAAWSSCVPWLKLSRNTSAPA